MVRRRLSDCIVGEPHMARHDVPPGRSAVYSIQAASSSLAIGGRRGWWRVRKKAREGRDTRGEAHGSSGRLTHGLCSGGSDEILMTRNAEFALKQGAGSLFHLKSERLPSGAVERRAPS